MIPDWWSTAKPDACVTLAEVASALELSCTRINNLVRAGKFPPPARLKHGNRMLVKFVRNTNPPLRFRVGDVLQWVRESQS